MKEEKVKRIKKPTEFLAHNQIFSNLIKITSKQQFSLFGTVLCPVFYSFKQLLDEVFVISRSRSRQGLSAETEG